MSEAKYTWQWKNQKGTWVNYAEDLNEQLNAAHRQGLKGTVVKHHWQNPKGKDKTTNYSVDFQKYTQINQDSYTERPIRCTEVKIMGPGPDVKGACDDWDYQGWMDDDGRDWVSQDAWAPYNDKKKKTSEDAKDKSKKTSEDAKDAADDGWGHDTAILFKGTAALFQEKQDSKEVDAKEDTQDSTEVDATKVLENLLKDKQDSKEVDPAKEDKKESKEVDPAKTFDTSSGSQPPFELMDWHHVALSGSQPEICPHWTSPGSWTSKLPFDRGVASKKGKKMYKDMYKFISMCKNKNV